MYEKEGSILKNYCWNCLNLDHWHFTRQEHFRLLNHLLIEGLANPHRPLPTTAYPSGLQPTSSDSCPPLPTLPTPVDPHWHPPTPTNHCQSPWTTTDPSWPPPINYYCQICTCIPVTPVSSCSSWFPWSWAASEIENWWGIEDIKSCEVLPS